MLQRAVLALVLGWAAPCCGSIRCWRASLLQSIALPAVIDDFLQTVRLIVATQIWEFTEASLHTDKFLSEPESIVPRPSRPSWKLNEFPRQYSIWFAGFHSQGSSAAQHLT